MFSRKMFSNQEESVIPVNKTDESMAVGVPHPGQTVFQLSNALRYFNKETILRQVFKDEDCSEINNITLALEIMVLKWFHQDETEENRNIDVSTPGSSSFSTDNDTLKSEVTSNIVENSTENGNHSTAYSKNTENTAKIELVLMFWMMSILPEIDAIKCKEIMDRDQHQWKISLYDVIMVFLNWGASSESLKLDDIDNPACSNIFTPKMPSPYSLEQNTKDVFPSCSNVCLVLTAISERLPDESQMPDRQKVRLIKLLMIAVLDYCQRPNTLYYYRTLRSIFDSFEHWDNNKARLLASDLELNDILPQSSIFLYTCVFNMMISERMLQVGILGCYNILHKQFQITVEPPSFSALVDKLTETFIISRYKCTQVYMLVQLVHSLLKKHHKIEPHSLEVSLEKLINWIENMHSAFKLNHYTYNVTGRQIRERLNRLKSECVEIQCSYHG